MVSELIKDSEDRIIGCKLEAIINNNIYDLDWKNLKNDEEWLMGWK